MEIIAAILYFSNFLLSAVSASFAALLFRRHRQVGWLLLGVSFLWPFFSLAIRALHGHRLFPYHSEGSDSNGVAHVTYYWQIPGFYMLVVVALLLLIRDDRNARKA